MIEIGLGVHGEAGVGQAPLCSAHEAVKRLLDHMTSSTSATRRDTFNLDSLKRNNIYIFFCDINIFSYCLINFVVDMLIFLTNLNI